MTQDRMDAPTDQSVDGAQVRPGLRHSLSWSLIGGIGAGALLFAQLIVAGRLLGPEQFGTFSFIQAFAMVLLIRASQASTWASSRALARAVDRSERQRIAASSIAAVAACSILAASLVILVAEPLAGLLSSTAQAVTYGAVFTVLLAQRWLMERELSGLGRFRQQAGVRFAEAFCTIATFIVLQTTNTLDDYRSLVVAYAVGAVTVVVGAHPVQWHRASTWRRVVVDGPQPPAVQLAHERGVPAATILFQADRFAINAALGAEQLGIYAAYGPAPSSSRSSCSW